MEFSRYDFQKLEHPAPPEYVGISEDRVQHILGVARECYQIAKNRGYDEDFCRRMFMIGWNHDVGYEFATSIEEHSVISDELIRTLDVDTATRSGQRVCHALRKHGVNTKTKSVEWRILTMADLTIDAKGNKVTAEQRLADIGERHGVNSEPYNKAKEVMVILELL